MTGAATVSVWAGVVLIGGSGPTDRHNGGYFDALAEHLLAAGVAVLRYDKRGAGESGGDWASANVDQLAIVIEQRCRALLPDRPVGPFLVIISALILHLSVSLPACCAAGLARSGRNERRHVISNERDMPCRRAVEDIARGVCRLSMTILSFSASDQRRRRPVSTTSSRSTSVLCLWLSISTVTQHST